MADGGHINAGVRLAVPMVEDFAYLARRMRPDEIDQFLAVSGLATFNADTAATVLIGAPGQKVVLLGPDNLPVVAGGFSPIAPGVVEAWMVGTMDGWAAHWRTITRGCRRLVDTQLETVHRVQVCSLAGRTQAHAWYERGVGFAREGVLRRWGARGDDFVMHSKVRP